MSDPNGRFLARIAELERDTGPVLAGPLLRKTSPERVAVWVAMKKACSAVELRIFARDVSPFKSSLADVGPEPCAFGSAATVMLGINLHLACVDAMPLDAAGLEPGAYRYDLKFRFEDGSEESLGSLSLLEERTLPNGMKCPPLGYFSGVLPGFVIPGPNPGDLRIFHGSCRKPHGIGSDALAFLDTVLLETFWNGGQSAMPGQLDGEKRHPHALFLTGDQIYADTVATSLLSEIRKISAFLQGVHHSAGASFEERIPGSYLGYAVDGRGSDDFGFKLADSLFDPLKRSDRIRKSMKGKESQNHLIGLFEFASMYILAWSPSCWPSEFIADVDFRGLDEAKRKEIRKENVSLSEFKDSIPLVQRALANVPTYMIFDDHDVTDDWFIDRKVTSESLNDGFTRRIIANALLAYSLFQGWGNDPGQYEDPQGAGGTLLGILRRRGEEIQGMVKQRGYRVGTGREFLTESPEVQQILGISRRLADPIGVPDPSQAKILRFGYGFDLGGSRVTVLDTRTERGYPTPDGAAELISKKILEERFGARSKPALECELNILVSPAPIIGLTSIERIQKIPLWKYEYDREAWKSNGVSHRHAMEALLKFKKVVVLSGDVHQSYLSAAADIANLQMARGGELLPSALQFTCSALKNVSWHLPIAGLASLEESDELRKPTDHLADRLLARIEEDTVLTAVHPRIVVPDFIRRAAGKIRETRAEVSSYWREGKSQWVTRFYSPLQEWNWDEGCQPTCSVMGIRMRMPDVLVRNGLGELRFASGNTNLAVANVWTKPGERIEFRIVMQTEGGEEMTAQPGMPGGMG